MGLILDTSVLIAAERGKLDSEKFFAHLKETPVFLAAITASELLHGVERAQNEAIRSRRSRFVESMLSQIPIIEFDLDAARSHSVLWSRLEVAGTMIGAHDLLIAATAVASGHAVATLNRKEFERIDQLELIDVEPFRI